MSEDYLALLFNYVRNKCHVHWAVVSVEIFLYQNVFCGGILIESKENVIFNGK
jgi:hypothetical protein